MKNHALIIQRDVICIYILLTYAVVQQKLIQQCKATILKKKKKKKLGSCQSTESPRILLKHCYFII